MRTFRVGGKSQLERSPTPRGRLQWIRTMTQCQEKHEAITLPCSGMDQGDLFWLPPKKTSYATSGGLAWRVEVRQAMFLQEGPDKLLFLQSPPPPAHGSWSDLGTALVGVDVQLVRQLRLILPRL